MKFSSHDLHWSTDVSAKLTEQAEKPIGVFTLLQGETEPLRITEKLTGGYEYVSLAKKGHESGCVRASIRHNEVCMAMNIGHSEIVQVPIRSEPLRCHVANRAPNMLVIAESGLGGD